MRGPHTQAQGAAGQEAPLWVLGPWEGSNLPRDPCVTPRDPAPTSSATCSSALAASSSCEGTGCFRASCGKAKGMWDQVEGAELHYSDLKEQRSSSLPGGLEGREV